MLLQRAGAAVHNYSSEHSTVIGRTNYSAAPAQQYISSRVVRTNYGFCPGLIVNTQTGDVVVVVVFFILTDRASTIPSNIRGCQSGTWSAGQKNIRGTSTKLQ